MTQKGVPDFSQVPTSLKVKHSNKTTLRFSTRTDYFVALRHQGLVSSEKDITGDPELVTKIQSHWQSHKGQIGCAFGQLLSNKPEHYKWHRIVVLEKNPKSWRLNKYIDRAIKDQNNAALSMIFPEVTTGNELVKIFRYFATLRRCHLEEIKKQGDTEVDTIIRLGLRIRLTKTIHAYALTFGPFPDLFPLTRQAPFTEIIFPSKTKVPPLRSFLTDDPKSAHLADLSIPFTDKAWEKLMRNTTKMKFRVLGQKHPGASAKVTISLPRRSWTSRDK